MDRWQNRVAVVTGASVGIGAAIVKDLLKSGVIVAALARRKELIEAYKVELPSEQKSLLHAVKCDITSVESVNEAFEWIIKELGSIDILINNAGTIDMGNVSTQSTSTLENTFKVNVFGLMYCTQHAFKSMKERNFIGHIININSRLGHIVPPHVVGMGLYPATKYAVTAISQILALEFQHLKPSVKVTNISPGLVDTDIVPKEVKASRISLKPENVSQCVIFALSTPPEVQIDELTVTANGIK